MSQLSEIEKIIHALAVQRSALAVDKVVWENQNGPRPVSPFVSLFGPRLQRVTEPEEFVKDVDPTHVQESRATQWEMYVTFSTHGLGAYDLAWSMQRGLFSPLSEALLAASPNDIVFVDAEPVQSLPQSLEKQFEHRAQFEARFRLNTVDSELPAPFIEKVNIERESPLPGIFGVPNNE